NAKLFPIRPGAMGKATPGFDVRIVSEQGEELPRGERGIIGVRQPNPCTMIEYWRNPEATQKKYAGAFLLTGDLGRQDEDGYFWYQQRRAGVHPPRRSRLGPRRDRGHAAQTSGRRAVRRGRYPRSDPHRSRESLDRAAPGLCAKRNARPRNPGFCEGPTRRPR